MESQKEGQLSFLKANTGAVMDQLDRLVLLKNMYEEDERKNGKEPLPSLQAAIEGMSVYFVDYCRAMFQFLLVLSSATVKKKRKTDRVDLMTIVSYFRIHDGDGKLCFDTLHFWEQRFSNSNAQALVLCSK